MITKRTLGSLVLGLILWSTQAWAGAWTHPQGGYYLKTSTNYLNTNTDIDASGSKVTKAGQGNLKDISYYLYIEYGLSDRLTLVATLPYRRLNDRRTFETGIARERRTGFGDTEVRARWALSTGRTPVAFAVGTKIPLWKPDGQTRVPLSTGKSDLDARVLAGRSFHPFPVYATSELGYRRRGGTFSDELFYTVESGISNGKLTFKGLVTGTQTLGDCTPMDEVGLVGDQNIFKISPAVIYAVSKRLEVSLELIHTATGCNTTGGSVFSVGIAIKHALNQKNTSAVGRGRKVHVKDEDLMAFIKTKKGWEIPEREATPESAYMDRRQFLKALGISTMSTSQLLTACSYDRSFESFDGSPISDPSSTPADILALYPATRNADFSMLDRDLTRADVAGSYNNFYEFSSGKTGIGELAQRLSLTPWSVEITGLVKNPMTLDANDIQRRFALEERLYRHRCVEAWSMAVPWTGFPLKALIDIVQPDSTARYVEMTTFINPEVAPGQFNNPQWPWPYRESITVEEAVNDLALIATGIYGRTLPSQHGAPIRLVIPWKYGFKSIKSIVKIEFVAERPTTFWNSLYPAAYGFTANVNPDVPHPNWPQSSEFMIGTNEIRATLPYNGYGDFVAHLYSDDPG